MRKSQIIFHGCMGVIALHMLMVLSTPLLSVNQLLYPIRIDSTFVVQQRSLERKLYGNERPALSSPSQTGLKYDEINFNSDSLTILKGWLAYDTTDVKQENPVLLIIPDIDEGKVCYIRDLMEFTARGFHTCVFDLRGQGNSGGDHYDPGMASTNDLKAIIRILKHKIPNAPYVAVLGVGSGAGIAMTGCGNSDFGAAALILQNPPESLNELFVHDALKEWGGFLYPILPILQRSYERTAGLSLKQHRYLETFSKSYIPFMAVAAGFITQRTLENTLRVYREGKYFRKRFTMEKLPADNAPYHEYDRRYYDRISGFIVSTSIRTGSKSRFHKIAAK